MGKFLVRSYEKEGDAQQVFKELAKHSNKSTQAHLESANYLHMCEASKDKLEEQIPFLHIALV